MTTRNCIFIVVSVLFGALSSEAGWHKFRLLRNAGLADDNATSADQCVAKCESTPGCSAVSYHQTTGVCLRSMCNNMDLYKTTGWNTYLQITALVEKISVPAVNFEWMLTDACGSGNQGTSAGPAVSLSSVTFAPSQSIFAGKAVNFTGGSSSNGLISGDNRINNPLGASSFSVMMWAKWLSDIPLTPLIEFVQDNSRGIYFWLAFGGLHFNYNSGTTGCVGSCSLDYAFTKTVDTWYHVAFVYDASAGKVLAYFNLSLVLSGTVTKISNSLTWNSFRIAYTPFHQGEMLGSLYCYKMANVALNSSDIAALAKSCYTAKIRFSE